MTATTSKPCWPARVVPPKGAPNVLLIMTDDQGYGISSTFGGVIPTPTLDRVAKAGLRYTQFHSTSLCSPVARGAAHRTQPSLGGIRRDRRTGHGLSGIRRRHRAEQREHRRNPEGERIRHLLVRQEPQHAGLPVQHVGTVRPVAERNGVRLLLRLHGWRIRPVEAVAVPGSHADFSVDRASPATTSSPTWRTRRSSTSGG